MIALNGLKYMQSNNAKLFLVYLHVRKRPPTAGRLVYRLVAAAFARKRACPSYSTRTNVRSVYTLRDELK